MARTSNLANVATVSRETKAWYPGGWDFTNGGAITGDFVEYANNVARDGAQGLLVEEASTNQIRNPRCEGASGTNEPTNFVIAGGGLTPTYEVVSLNGWPGFRVTLSGTASGTIQILFDGVGVIAASSGQNWTLSTGVILESGTFPVTMEHMVQERSSGGSLLTATNTEITPTSSHKRFVTSRTLTDGSTAFVSAGVRFPAVSGAVSCTFVILAPQLEEKAYPTSPILPPASSPAASDRDADDIEVADGAWSNDGGAGTLYISATLNYGGVSGSFPRIAAYGDDTSNEILFFLSGSSSIAGAARFGGAEVAAGTAVTLTGAGQNFKSAAAFAENDFSFSSNGAAQSTDASGSVAFTSPKLSVGQQSGGGGNVSTAYIKDIRYWPRRLTNAELEALVGN